MRTLATALFLFALGAIVAHLTGCKTACAIIDLANQACPLVVQYTDRTGAKRAVVVGNDDARELAAIKAARADAGAP